MLNYRLALINVGWFSTSNYNRYFDSLEEQKAYFESKGAMYLASFSNFNFNDNVFTSVTYTDTSDRSIEELLACNYVLVEKDNKYRYFFARVTQKSGRTFYIDLELDDIQTNYFRYKDTIKNAQIKRAHINRWEHVENETYQFKLGENSPFLVNTEELPQRIETSRKLYFKWTNDNELNNWLNENVKYWCYIYLASDREYKGQARNGDMIDVLLSDFIFNIDGDNPSRLDYTIIAYPITKENRSVNFKYKAINETEYTILEINDEAFQRFKSNNNNTSFFYTIKYSIIPPFTYESYDYEINENNNLYFIYNTLYKPYLLDDAYFQMYNNGVISTASVESSDGTYLYSTGLFCNINQDVKEYISNEMYTTFDNTYLKEDIKSYFGEDISPLTESFGFKKLRIRTQLSDGFYYDYLKMNSKRVSFKYTEALTPDITKGYIRLNTINDIYKEASQVSGLGELNSEDNSFIYDNDQLSSYLANNKNAFLQTAFKIGGSLITGGGSYTSIASGAIQTLDFAMSLDNMSEAPKNLANAKGNILFNNLVKDLGVYVEEYDCLRIDKQIQLDKINEIGYKLDISGYPKHYDNIRINHNYLSCERVTITAPISNLEKERLSEKLKDIIFFNNDFFDTHRFNYERSLEEE